MPVNKPWRAVGRSTAVFAVLFVAQCAFASRLQGGTRSLHQTKTGFPDACLWYEGWSACSVNPTVATDMAQHSSNAALATMLYCSLQSSQLTCEGASWPCRWAPLSSTAGVCLTEARMAAGLVAGCFATDSMVQQLLQCAAHSADDCSGHCMLVPVSGMGQLCTLNVMDPFAMWKLQQHDALANAVLQCTARFNEDVCTQHSSCRWGSNPLLQTSMCELKLEEAARLVIASMAADAPTCSLLRQSLLCAAALSPDDCSTAGCTWYDDISTAPSNEVVDVLASLAPSLAALVSQHSPQSSACGLSSDFVPELLFGTDAMRRGQFAVLQSCNAQRDMESCCAAAAQQDPDSGTKVANVSHCVVPGTPPPAPTLPPVAPTVPGRAQSQDGPEDSHGTEGTDGTGDSQHNRHSAAAVVVASMVALGVVAAAVATWRYRGAIRTRLFPHTPNSDYEFVSLARDDARGSDDDEVLPLRRDDADSASPRSAANSPGLRVVVPAGSAESGTAEDSRDVHNEDHSASKPS